MRYTFPDEVSGPTDMNLKGDLAESWTSSPDARVWTFKLRQGVKWHNVPPLNGREFVAADVKYCFEAYAKEGAQSFTFQELEGIETPDKHTVRIHLKTPNVSSPRTSPSRSRCSSRARCSRRTAISRSASSAPGATC